MLVAVLTPSSTTESRVYHAYSDHLNAPRLLIDMAGAQRWRWLSEPFGTTPAEAVPSSIETLAVNLRFPGQNFDKESGLNYNYFRDYDATTGRYVQSDLIGLAGGLNTYTYVSGNPISKMDPLGLLENYTFDRRAGTVTHDCECSSKTSTTAFSGNYQYANRPEYEAFPEHGPIPAGKYYIVQPYNYSRTNPSVFFRLFRDDGVIDDETFVPDPNNPGESVRRGQFRFHPGTASNGCITVPNRKTLREWNKIQEQLMRTKTSTIPGTNIEYYGTVTVK
ncbi:RHS repeat-associated core domain-containing protein [Roseateles amylovorans]|uniref:DUF2778 domain-containing protein n=1 Tax=Roseateles amylovorans TaxID=2978473 RepID=A0ABY6B1T1_9BURK|nr:RHS repeat-associated core domain-containing protein [Roseateles amylovorans]UXH78156.1 DUF2778 domain-containing protein [Roseateles amylovorans]